MSTNKPFEFLAAFAVCFLAGAATNAAISGYASWLKRKYAPADNSSREAASVGSPPV